MSKAIALIPARGGSKRVPGKNTKLLAGHPLLAYTICAALDSGCFEKVLVSSDDTKTLDIAARYGADCLRRPDEFASDTSPDIEWVRHALDAFRPPWDNIREAIIQKQCVYDTFSILRPTSPFRKPETIRRAFEDWNEANGLTNAYSSLRAVERVSQHPGKMWRIQGRELVPILMQPQQPWHDSQYTVLPEVWVQNASLEIAHVSTVLNTGTISGQRVMAFRTSEEEGYDVNTEYDWRIAEEMLDEGIVSLPAVRERVSA